VHAALPEASANVPAPQAVHWLASSREKDPAAHSPAQAAEVEAVAVPGPE
jgi:hypothetical protein